MNDSVFSWAFMASNGDAWFGTTYGDSTAYYDEQWWWAPGGASLGYYYVYNEQELNYDVSDYYGAAFEDGMTYVTSYYDSNPKTFEQPWYNRQGYPSGTNWIGSEYDYNYHALTRQWDDFGWYGIYTANVGTVVIA